MKLIDVIKEQHEFELTEEYPEGFDINEFKNIWSYAGKLKYAQEHLGKPIGNGSSRTVYRVDKEKVLKLAKNKKGVAQNDQETNWVNDGYYESVLAKVFDFDDKDFLWVEMEVAYRAKRSDFKRLWNINFDDLSIYLRNAYDRNKGRRPTFGIDDEVKIQLDENENVQLLMYFMLDSFSSEGDLTKLNSWGLVKRDNVEHLVLIDFGLNEDVYTSYYGVK